MHLVLFALLLCIAVSAPGLAQRLEPAGIVSTGAVSATTRSPGWSRPAKAAAIGAAAGGIAGIVYSYMRTHRREVTDHSEDGYIYLIAVPTGVLAGFWLGALVGKLSERPNEELKLAGAPKP